jgi:GTPase SAR1 family protein
MDSLEADEKLFRIVMIGITSIGKTSIISQLVHGQFDTDEQSTGGDQFNGFLSLPILLRSTNSMETSLPYRPIRQKFNRLFHSNGFA